MLTFATSVTPPHNASNTECTMSSSGWGGAAGGSSNGVPAWAARAHEPLVPALDLPNIRKTVARDLQQLRRASEEIAKLSRKRSANSNERLLALSTEAREVARGTSRVLREAFASAEDGSAEHAALTTLQDDFKRALRQFQKEAERAAPPSPAAAAPLAAPRAAALPAGAIAVDMPGVADPGGACAPPRGSDEAEAFAAQQSAQLQQVALNDQILSERERGISQINRTVNEVAEIFQDMALLVSEQGEHIDNIQTNIETAASQTSKGVAQLAKASRHQRRARKRMCCVTVMLFITIIVLFLVLKFAVKAF